MLTWLDRASSRLVLGAVAPVILLLTGWWGTLGVLGDNPAIGPAALGGLALGVTLDFTVLRNRLDSLFDLGPIALGVLALFYSIMIYGFFMGLPVGNLLVGLVGGYAVGRKAALHGSSPESAVTAARVTAGIVTAILAVLCAASAWMALNEPTIELQVRGMLGLPFEVTRSMIYATILGGGTALLAAQYSGTILIARRASQIA